MMLKILVVDDDTAKLRHVLTSLKAMPECDGSEIDNAGDATAAKRLLRQNQYDLLVLDIALPERPGQSFVVWLFAVGDLPEKA